MKKIIFLSLIIALIIGSCTQEVKSPIEGVWRIVSWNGMVGDSIVAQLGVTSTGSEMVIYAKNHFLWVGHYKTDTILWDNFGGGTYTLQGNKLEDKIEFSEAKDWIGTTIRLKWEVKNDTATQTWPLDENWNLNKKEYYGVQKWIRLE